MTGMFGSPSGRENPRVATTVEIAQRTDRWARFAAVTVEVATTADQTVMVESSADDRDDVRQEAACGARTALRAIPASGHGLRLTVTDIRTVAGETGVGDVHEATARAVWQALGIDPEPAYVGFNEPEVVTAWLRDRIGLRLAAVTEARHWYLGRRDPDNQSLVHAWLHFNQPAGQAAWTRRRPVPVRRQPVPGLRHGRVRRGTRRPHVRTGPPRHRRRPAVDRRRGAPRPETPRRGAGRRSRRPVPRTVATPPPRLPHQRRRSCHRPRRDRHPPRRPHRPGHHLDRPCADPDTIARVCRDTRDRAAIPRLRELADADQRATFTSEVSTKIWRDEAHRDAIRTAIAHLDNHI